MKETNSLGEWFKRGLAAMMQTEKHPLLRTKVWSANCTKKAKGDRYDKGRKQFIAYKRELQVPPSAHIVIELIYQ